MSRQRHNQKMLSTTTPSLSKDEVLKCTGQKDNFLQFARLIMVAGTRLFRDLFNHLCPPEILPRKLSSLVEKLPRLNRHELKCLYPSRERCVTSDDFDISLLFKLLRVIVVEEPDGGWDELPKESDHKISDELVRIKYYRNEICHSCYNQEISDESFFELWEYIKGAMIGIAKQLPEGIEPWESAIDGLLKYPITSVEEQSEKELIEWYFRDMELKKELQEVKNVCNQIYMGVKKLLKERGLIKEDEELSEETSFAGSAKKRQLTEEDKELPEEMSPAGPAQKRPLTGEDKELSEETSFAGPAQKRPMTEKDKELSEETSAAGPAQKRRLTEEDKERSEETSPTGPAQKRRLTEENKERPEETSSAGPAQRQAEKRTNSLHVAAKKGDIEVIKLVLPYYEIDSLGESGQTPLMVAAAVGNKAAFQMLMQNHANPRLKCPLGNCLLHFAVEGGNKHILTDVLSLNLDVNQRNHAGVTPLATAAIWGNQGAFDLLLKNKADEFLISKDGYSVLHFAAFAGIVPIIRELISRGLDPNLEDRFGSTPLMTATEESKSEAVEYLLSIGAR